MSDLRPIGMDSVMKDTRAGLREMDVGQNLALRDLADIFREGEEDIFRTQGGAIGKQWKALKPGTVRSRRRLIKKFGLQIGASSPILENFSDLRHAMTRKGGAHHQQVLRETVRLSVDQSAVNRHNRKTGQGMGLTSAGKRRKARGKGGRYPDNIVEIHDEGKGSAPKRPIVGVPDAREEEMEARVRKYLDNVARLMVGSEGLR